MNIWNFNVSLTNDVVSFEQPGPGLEVQVPVNQACYSNKIRNIILTSNLQVLSVLCEIWRPGPEIIKCFSCSIQLSMKF